MNVAVKTIGMNRPIPPNNGSFYTSTRLMCRQRSLSVLTPKQYVSPVDRIICSTCCRVLSRLDVCHSKCIHSSPPMTEIGSLRSVFSSITRRQTRESHTCSIDCALEVQVDALPIGGRQGLLQRCVGCSQLPCCGPQGFRGDDSPLQLLHHRSQRLRPAQSGPSDCRRVRMKVLG